MPTHSFGFAPGERVHVDGDKSIVGVITRAEWRYAGGFHGVNGYEVSWLSNGDAKFVWFDEFRLSLRRLTCHSSNSMCH